MMSRALLVAGAVLSTSFAAKLAAAPSIQESVSCEGSVQDWWDLREKG